MMSMQSIPNTRTQTSYIHVDSAQRQRQPVHIYGEMISLPPFPLAFTSQSSLVQILYPDHGLRIGDQLMLSNVISKSLMLSGVISVKKGSSYLRINHANHGFSLHGLFDPSDASQFIRVEYVGILPRFYAENDDIPDPEPGYYIWKGNQTLDLMVHISGLQFQSGAVGNIYSNLLNGKHRVYLIYRMNGSIFQPDPNAWLLSLNTISSVNYMDAQTNGDSLNSIYLSYRNLFGIPLYYLNHNPNESDNNYVSVVNLSQNTIEIDVGYPAIVDPYQPFYSSTDCEGQLEFDTQSPINWHRGGGEQVYLRTIISTQPGYPTPSIYKYSLDRTYRNVSQVRLIASTFPNSQRLINASNNKLRWRRIEAGNRIFELVIRPGNYDTASLEQAFNTASKLTNHDLRLKIDTATDIVTISAYKHQIVTDSLQQSAIIVPDNIIELVFDSALELNIPVLAYFTVLASPHTRLNLYTSQSSPGPNFGPNPSSRSGFVPDPDPNPNTRQLSYDSMTQILIQTTDPPITTSINTSTTLVDYEYDPQIRRLFRPNHNLRTGAIIITDKLEPKIETYVVLEVLDSQSLILAPYVCCFILDHHYWGLPKSLIMPAFNLEIPPHPRQRMQIRHPDHQLKIGTHIRLSHSYAVNTVPAHTINATHTISRILDLHTYEISLESYTPLDVLDQPNTVNIQYPDTIQLLFNHAETIGSYLGFRHTNTPLAITSFNHIHTNIDPYINDEIATIPVPKLNLSGYSYFYLCCKQLPSIHRTCPVPNVFAIVRWTDNPPNLVFDSFVPTTGIIPNLLPILSELDISLVNPDGTLVDFNQIDHIFTLEVVESIQLPARTEISARQELVI